jgi:hypothetical protein
MRLELFIATIEALISFLIEDENFVGMFQVLQLMGSKNDTFAAIAQGSEDAFKEQGLADMSVYRRQRIVEYIHCG